MNSKEICFVLLPLCQIIAYNLIRRNRSVRCYRYYGYKKEKWASAFLSPISFKWTQLVPSDNSLAMSSARLRKECYKELQAWFCLEKRQTLTLGECKLGFSLFPSLSLSDNLAGDERWGAITKLSQAFLLVFILRTLISMHYSRIKWKGMPLNQLLLYNAVMVYVCTYILW